MEWRIVCCADAINDTTFNVALNKPVFCSSVLLKWYGTYNFVPQLANDGSLETDAHAGGEANCYHSLHGKKSIFVVNQIWFALNKLLI